MVCANCGETYHHDQSGGKDRGKGMTCCSLECYLTLPFPLHPFITTRDITRARRMYPTQAAQARALGVSYPQYRRGLKKHLQEG